MWILLPAFAQVPPPVVGGEPVEDGGWPDAAAVYKGSQVACTGTLIAPTVVLTAGHCVGGITRVKVGAADYTDRGEGIDVVSEHAYPDSARTYDLGVLLLESAGTVPPRTLALDCVTEELYDGATVRIVGYGWTEPGGTSTTRLNEAETLVTDADCSAVSIGCNAAVSPGGEVAAGGDGIDSCAGDSGGPLYIDHDGASYLLGVTSRGVNGSVECGQGGIYARPGAIVEWIEATAGVSLARPDCGSGTTDSTPPTDSGATDTGELLEPPSEEGRALCACSGSRPASWIGVFLAAAILRRR